MLSMLIAMFDRLTLWQHVRVGAQTTADRLLIQCSAALCFVLYITWLGTLWDTAVPDLMGELGSVVVHVDYIDHNVNRVFYLVAIQVHCMGSQLEENTNTSGLYDCSSKDCYQLCKQYVGRTHSLNITR